LQRAIVFREIELMKISAISIPTTDGNPTAGAIEPEYDKPHG
jgi:hypothetical protein